MSSAAQSLIIVPTYNEAANVTILGAAIFQATPAVHVLFVDDHSQDGTPAQIARLQLQYQGRVHVLSRAAKLGLGTAYIAGFQWALPRGYQVVVQMDADLSHDPAYVPELLALLEHYDAVIGSRYMPGGGTCHWGLLRRCLSQSGATYARWLLGLTLRDPTGGYNAWHRRVLEAIDVATIRSEGYAFQIELKYRAVQAGFRLGETPIVFVERRVGHSKMSLAIVLEAVWRTWRLRAERVGALTPPR